VCAAGKAVVDDDGNYALPASSIILPEVYTRRERQYQSTDRAFICGEEVAVTLDCTAHTLRLQSNTVDHTIDIEEQHRTPQQQWVLNVNFSYGDFEVELV